jgi:hypothetical protein
MNTPVITFWLSLVSLLVSPFLVFADTIFLKSGELVEGKIVSQSDASVQIKVSLAGGSIVSTRTFQRSDIKTIALSTPEQETKAKLLEAYQDTQRHELDPQSSLPLEEYDHALKDVFGKFLKDYPNSPYTDEITKKIKDWEAERDQVASGQIKYHGKWLAGDEAKGALNSVKAEKLSREGVKLLANDKFDDAIDRFKAILALKDSLPAELVADANQKCLSAYDEYLTSLQKQLTDIRQELVLYPSARSDGRRLVEEGRVGDALRELEAAKRDLERVKAQENRAREGGEGGSAGGAPDIGGAVSGTTPAGVSKLGFAKQATARIAQAEGNLQAAKARRSQLQGDAAAVSARIEQVRSARSEAKRDSRQAVDPFRQQNP